jgi:hypothetical protein
MVVVNREDTFVPAPPTAAPGPELRLDRRLVLLLLPFAGGAGLVVHVLVDVSLPLAFALLAVVGTGLVALSLRRLSPATRALLGVRLRAGVLGGVLGTAAYDSARYGLVAVFRMSFQPFHVFEIFGRLFVGDGVPVATATAVGFAYHVSNGVCFGIAYATLLSRSDGRSGRLRRPGVVTGVLWGIGLELAMALLYPSWLRIEALREFLTVSAFGHVIYGGVLGSVVARRLATRPVRAAA